MFDVLVYLYENYWRPDACPEHEQLTRKLTAVGFESDEIEEALTWLDGLAAHAPRPTSASRATRSMRVYSPAEQEHSARIDRLHQLPRSAGVLPPPMREMVIDRATRHSGRRRSTSKT